MLTHVIVLTNGTSSIVSLTISFRHIGHMQNEVNNRVLLSNIKLILINQAVML
jgi:hypothetical protein